MKNLELPSQNLRLPFRFREKLVFVGSLDSAYNVGVGFVGINILSQNETFSKAIT